MKKDKRVPWVSKALMGLAMVYFLSPIDLIPEFIPIAGQLDDLVVVSICFFLAIKLIPKKVYLENYQDIFEN